MQIPQFGPRTLGGVEHGARVHEQGVAGFRGDDPAPGPDQQTLSELSLEEGDLAAQARLRQVQRDRGATETAGVDNADEVLELAEIHRNKA